MKTQAFVSIPSGMFKNASAHSFFPDASELQSINANLFEAATLRFCHSFEEPQDFTELYSPSDEDEGKVKCDQDY